MGVFLVQIRASLGLAMVVMCLTGTLLSGSAAAATVRQLAVNELIQESALIFHGVAVERRAIKGAREGQIFTRVMFRVVDVISGPKLARVELDFLGGTLDGLTLSVSGMTVPRVGEEGVYFVEQLAHAQVNPLHGWWQGYFAVRADSAGGKIVTTFGREPVYDLQLATSASAAEINTGGAATGVVTEASDRRRSPMTLDEFKYSLRRLVEFTR